MCSESSSSQESVLKDRMSLDALILCEREVFSKTHEKHHTIFNTILVVLLGVALGILIGFLEKKICTLNFLLFLFLVASIGAGFVSFLWEKLSNLETSFELFYKSIYFGNPFISELQSEFEKMSKYEKIGKVSIVLVL